MLTNVEVKARVERGAALLDAHGPENWRRKIDTESLNMLSNCILEQLYPGEDYATCTGYLDGIEELAPWMPDDYNGATYGFAADGFESAPLTYWDDLRAAWVELLSS